MQTISAILASPNLLIFTFMLLPATTVFGDIEVSPIEFSQKAGDTFDTLPFSTKPSRYQQAYSGLSSGLIEDIFVRMHPGFIGFRMTIDMLQIDLSTMASASDKLSPVFQENIGSDQAVFVGPREAIISIPRSGDDSPQPFIFAFHAEHPFQYDATKEPCNNNFLLLRLTSDIKPTWE